MPAVKCMFLCELFVFLASVKGHGVRSEQRPRYQGYIFVFQFLVEPSQRYEFIFPSFVSVNVKKINKDI